MHDKNYQNKLKDYFNVIQLRLDHWNELKVAANHLKKKSGDSAQQTSKILDAFDVLKLLEQYWTYPGVAALEMLRGMYRRKEYVTLAHTVSDIVRLLSSETYRDNPLRFDMGQDREKKGMDETTGQQVKKNGFDVLIVDNLNAGEQRVLVGKLAEIKDDREQFHYDVVIVNSFQDALISILFNTNIQACVIRYGIPYPTTNNLEVIQPFITRAVNRRFEKMTDHELGPILGREIQRMRPEVDLYYVTDISLNQIDDKSLQLFRRIFYRKEDLQEIHLSIIRGIKDRYETPFFSALVEYSQKPTGVFHAMPISRGNSVFKSRWIQDFGEFYGRNLFLAETSATTGGLDSLLHPTGPLKKAQENAARAFGSLHTFFVTNGTSTANKIVVQALIEPGDFVLIDRDCHKSHHYGLVLGGGYPVYLDSYPVQQYSMYGAVPLQTIKDKLLQFKAAGQLDRVKMLLLTNCTFDGIVYNVERVMEEALAIKPDLIFLWDEAWFAFAAFTPIYKQRTAMYVAQKLYRKYARVDYRQEYDDHCRQLAAGEVPRLPDPDKVKIRVYATQSTHKTLSSLRQGSMIHIYDEEFKRRSETAFLEAYMTHTSTSANYQILASLDVGRRQVQFEGYEMVEKSIEMAMSLRWRIQSHPKLKRYFDVLTVKNFIPEEYRQSAITQYHHPETGWNRMEEAWEKDEFVLDPTKINIFVGKTGVDGDTFKNFYLMNQFGIQINKTSRNTVLFMTNIGSTKSSVAYLIGVLLKIAAQLDEKFKAMNATELQIEEAKIKSLTTDLPPLPHFSQFHSSFRIMPNLPGGNIREAYFLAYNENNCAYMHLEECLSAITAGNFPVSASFIIPYPPGFPVLVPGQVASHEIIEFLLKLDVKEIHGFRPELGLRIFKDSALAARGAPAAAGQGRKEIKAGNNGQTLPTAGQ